MIEINRQHQSLWIVALWLAFFLPSVLVNPSRAGEPAERNPKQWLERMIKATKEQSYEGEFVYLQGQTLEAMHIAYSSRSNQQRMISLTGPVREVVVKEGAVMCLLPNQKVTVSAADNHNRSLFPISLPHKLSLLEAHYEFKVLGYDRVADRKTLIVAIEPRDRLRFGYRLWLDYATSMVLRSAMVDNDGQFLEQLMFTTVDFRDDIDKSLLNPSHFLLSQVPEDTAEKNPSEPLPWHIGELPPGFKQIMRQRYPSAHASTDDALTEHLVYSDGLATVSVFLEPLTGSQTALLEGASKMDAMNAFGKVVQGYQILVVGEVPSLTVERLATAIQPAF